MKTKLLIILSSLVFLMLALSCEKEENDNNFTQPPTNQEAVDALAEYALINKLFADAANETNAAAIDADNQLQGTEGNDKSFPIIIITPLDLETWPKTVVVNYGETNVLCNDSTYRRGILNFVTTGWHHDVGTEITLTFDDYYQNDYKVEGTQVITNLGRNDVNNLRYSVDITEGVVTTPDDKVINYEENTIREWFAGEDTPFIVCDDIWLVEGNQNGISSDQITYSLEVIERLRVQVCCKWITQGVLNVNIQGLPTLSIDYGEGGCNPSAVVSILGMEYPIVME